MRLVRCAAAVLSVTLLLQPQLQAMVGRAAPTPMHDMASMASEGEMTMPTAPEPTAPVEDCHSNALHHPCDGSPMSSVCVSIGACPMMALQSANLRLTFDSPGLPERTAAPLALRAGIMPRPESPPPRA